MEMYRHATRVDSAELATEKTCRLAPTKKIIWGAWSVTIKGPIRTISLFTILGGFLIISIFYWIGYEFPILTFETSLSSRTSW